MYLPHKGSKATIMTNIYMLSDAIILSKIGDRLKSIRLKQNITQQSLAKAACVSLSSVKKIEKGEIGSFDSFLRIVRTLGQLDIFLPLIEEEQLSPSEYYKITQEAHRHSRKRAAGTIRKLQNTESEW